MTTKTKQRSPNYPGQALGASIEDMNKLYQAEGRAPFSLDTGAKALGYPKGLNGVARVRLAALRQYGLIEQKKGAEAKLTDRALALVLRNQATREYKEALKAAAFEPALFKQIYETKSTASDDNLMHHLVVNEGFTNDGAKRFIESFRATMSIANLTDDGKISSQEDGESSESERKGDKNLPPSPTPEATDRVIPLPLSPTKWVNLRGSFPVTEEEWTLMLAVLNAHKPGLVLPPGQQLSVPRPAQREGIQEEEDEEPNALEKEVRALLESVDRGGIPAFITANLQSIARRSGITVEPSTTPNQVIDQLKARYG